jgi:phytoene dehydrogenase-like protein
MVRDDFAKDYNAYKGTALGLAHTLFQTAIFRPAHRSKKVKGLYYTGQYTHPGVGVPMTLIASELVADLVNKDVYGQT